MVYLMKKQLNLDFLLSEVIDPEASFEHLSFIHTFILYILMAEILKMNTINLNRRISNYIEK